MSKLRRSKKYFDQDIGIYNKHMDIGFDILLRFIMSALFGQCYGIVMYFLGC